MQFRRFQRRFQLESGMPKLTEEQEWFLSLLDTKFQQQEVRLPGGLQHRFWPLFGRFSTDQLLKPAPFEPELTASLHSHATSMHVIAFLMPTTSSTSLLGHHDQGLF